MSTVCIDLDGVLAQYDGWKGEDVLGEPAPGALEFVRRLLGEGHTVVVHTTRDPVRVANWLEEHDFYRRGVDLGRIYPTQQKEPALVYIDDRGFRFTGDWEAAYRAIKEPAWWQAQSPADRANSDRVSLTVKGTWEYPARYLIGTENGVLPLTFDQALLLYESLTTVLPRATALTQRRGLAPDWFDYVRQRESLPPDGEREPASKQTALVIRVIAGPVDATLSTAPVRNSHRRFFSQVFPGNGRSRKLRAFIDNEAREMVRRVREKAAELLNEEGSP